MVLVRIAYAADLPTPDEVVRSLAGSDGAAAGRLQSGGDTTGTTARAEAPRDASRGAPRAALASAPQRQQQLVQEPMPQDPGPAPNAAVPTLARFEDLIALAAERRDLQTRTALERDLRLVRFEPGRLEIALEPNASKALIGDLARRISQWTGQRWMVVVSSEQGQPTVRSQIEARRADLERGVQADPLVKAVLARFPGAQIVAVREGLQDAPASSIEGDVLPPEPPIDDDSSVFAERIRPDDPDDT
jgi:DNA polymerase-3 subunit gamma/tau